MTAFERYLSCGVGASAEQGGREVPTCCWISSRAMELTGTFFIVGWLAD
ncbi:MAG: hypothetical protein R2910_09085 [Gemmatimonadales bacterium]